MSNAELSEAFVSLACSQGKEVFHRVEGGLMELLRECLESESKGWMSTLCGHVDHFQSTWDAGWGCGWRNIQMLSSYLLRERPESTDLLYGGCGFVPTIESLQGWLELAWRKGFDVEGAGDFDDRISGKKSWIGTTECATMLRSFGLRARIVDFCSKDSGGASSSSHSLASKGNSGVYGPMDAFLSSGKLGSYEGVSSQSASWKKDMAQRVLAEWVWNHFSSNSPIKPSENSVILSKKGPLYFQHDGHSRTIVGIQVKHQRNGVRQYNLLIFDPSSRTAELERALRRNAGWQSMIKRGIHTLNKPQYQLCFVDPGVAHGEELEALKKLDSIRQEF